MKQPINSKMETMEWAWAKFIQSEFYAPLTDIVFWGIRKIMNKNKWSNNKDVQEFLKECEEQMSDKQFYMKQSKPDIGGFNITSEIINIIGDGYSTSEWFKKWVANKYALGQAVEIIYATALQNLSKKGIAPYEAIDRATQKSQIQAIHDSITQPLWEENNDLDENNPEMQEASELADMYKSQIPTVRNPKTQSKENLEKERNAILDKPNPNHVIPKGPVKIGMRPDINVNIDETLNSGNPQY